MTLINKIFFIAFLIECFLGFCIFAWFLNHACKKTISIKLCYFYLLLFPFHNSGCIRKKAQKEIVRQNKLLGIPRKTYTEFLKKENLDTNPIYDYRCKKCIGLVTLARIKHHEKS